nr:MAG TPA: hypothetical protein [Caudoviricetes sp.]
MSQSFKTVVCKMWVLKANNFTIDTFIVAFGS